LLLTDYTRFTVLVVVVLVAILSVLSVAILASRHRPQRMAVAWILVVIVLAAASIFVDARLTSNPRAQYLAFDGWVSKPHGKERVRARSVPASECDEPHIAFTDRGSGNFEERLECAIQWSDLPGAAAFSAEWGDWTPIPNTLHAEAVGLAVNKVGARQARQDVTVELHGLSTGAFYTPLSTSDFDSSPDGYKWKADYHDNVGFEYIKQPYSIASPFIISALKLRSVPTIIYVVVTGLLLFAAHDIVNPLIADWLKDKIKARLSKKAST
jgi:hypothetical protein